MGQIKMDSWVDEIKVAGFSEVKLKPSDLIKHGKKDLDILQDAFHHLPADPYGGESANRFRAYSKFLIMPWSEEICEIPSAETEAGKVVGYFQGEFNPEQQKSSIRYLKAIPQSIRQGKLLKALIRHDYRATFWNRNQSYHPIHVGVHMVRLCVSKNNPVAVSSPNFVHRDGEQFTFAHLIDRKNCTGGENVIAKREAANLEISKLDKSDILKKFGLKQPLHTYGVCDKMVSHYVSPLKFIPSQKGFGYRHILLIDFSAMAQQLDQVS